MRWLACLVVSMLAPGCVTTVDMPTYVVHFTLSNLGNETLEFSGYPHCATAEVHRGHVLVQDARPRGKAIVVADPALAWRGEAGFASLGDAAAAFGLDPEARSPSGVAGHLGAVVTLRLEDGRLLVNGVEQVLPYSGTSRWPGAWQAEFTVSEGPDRVKVDRRAAPCA